MNDLRETLERCETVVHDLLSKPEYERGVNEPAEEDPGAALHDLHDQIKRSLKELSASEVQQLREQRDDLQRRCGELLTQSRGVRYQVDEFHERYGYERPRTPVKEYDEELVRFRCRLMAEEFLEVLEAAYDHGSDQWQKGRLTTRWSGIKNTLDAFVNTCPVRVNVPEFIDGLADLDYVVEGTRISFGIDGRPIAAEVHRANMSKTPKSAENTKVTKPPGWRPPDIVGELRKQGWKGDVR